MTFRYLFILIASLTAYDAAAKQTLTVLTAYHEEVVAQFETTFERDHPDIDVKIIWRMPHDALPYLRQRNQGGVDVYWSASLHNYLQLKQEGAWQKLKLDRDGLPEMLGVMPLIDPDGFYCATEMAGYGFVVNPGYLKNHRLPEPKTWQDLIDTRYSGHIALPVPSRFGFAPLMIDSILQQYGWERGWALLSELAGNAQLLEHNRSFITDVVGSGELGIAPSLDFFANSARANGAPLQLLYPEPVAYSPAHIAVTASTRQPQAAQQFVEFILSAKGQRLLFHPDIRKLPVRPAVYADKPEGQFDPFEAAVLHSPVYDPSTALPRLAVQNALFDLFLTERHDQLKPLWQRLHELETQNGRSNEKLVEVRHLLTAAPISLDLASDIFVQQNFEKRIKDADADMQAKSLENTWRSDISRNYQRAEQLLAAWGH
jgi:phosphoglycerate transport regulatory protein PgtC